MNNLPIIDSNDFVEISEEDYELLRDTKIYFSKRKHICIRLRKKLKRLNKVILERKLGRLISNGYECVHIDKNAFNNKRENLIEVASELVF